MHGLSPRSLLFSDEKDEPTIVVLALNRLPAKTFSSMFDLLDEAPPNESVSLLIKTGGSEEVELVERGGIGGTAGRGGGILLANSVVEFALDEVG